jgi:arginine utilization protein RocB
LVQCSTDEVVQRLARQEQGYEDLQQANQQLQIQLAEVSTYRDLQVQARHQAEEGLKRVRV